MDDLISKQEVLEDLSEPFVMSQCLTVEECEAMNRARKLCLARVERIEPAQRWIPVTERLPGEFVSVQAHMTDAEPFPSVREAYLTGGEWFFPALNEYHPVDKWAEFLEPQEEKCYVQEKVR